MCKLVCSSLLNCFHIVGKCIKGVHWVRQSDEVIMSQHTTCHCKRQCQSFKVTVLLPYQVLPDIERVPEGLERVKQCIRCGKG
jgi:hypothetical protein